MRIISGEFRGRKLLPPQSLDTRPITDRVKQSLFDILNPNLPEVMVYDCFAGTGSMGLEALSRGANRAVFFEYDPSAAALLKRNIEALNLSAHSRIVTADIFDWADSTPPPTRPVDVLFFDPPYRFLTERADDLKRLIETLAKDHLSEQAIVVFRHAAGDALDLPPLVRYDQREYGSMVIDLLTCQSNLTNISSPPTQPE
jgi:16S rRNA (guanine(966)-N(2))-methyltransferase RsmD